MTNKVITGVIEKAFKKDNGLCSIKVGDTWYSTYKTHVPEFEGKTCEVTVVQKGKYWNVVSDKNDVPAIKVIASAAPAGRSGGGGGFNSDDRQNSIVLQSSYKTASDVVIGAATAGYLPMPTKKADQWDAFKAYIDEYALELFTKCANATEYVSNVADDEDPAPADEAEYNPMEA